MKNLNKNFYFTSLLHLILVCQFYRCYPDKLNNLSNFTELKNAFLSQDISHFQSRDKRLFLPYNNLEFKSNNTYQSCVTPSNASGYCKHLSSCILDEFKHNFTRFIDYMCIIEQDFVGVCCPDDSLLASNSAMMEDALTGILPAIAIADEVQSKLESSEKSEASNASRSLRAQRGCGVNSKIRTRVAGGKPSAPKDWPWMAALLRNNQEHYCGAVLITDRHVLTAAHCVYKHRPRDVSVRLGEYDFTKKDDTRHIDFKVAEIRMHHDFNTATYEHDIAILKMRRATVFNSYIWPICLPPVDLTFENANAFIIGWGTQYYNGPASSILMEVSVPVWPQSKCVHSFTQHIPETVVCAGGFQGGRDACQGDSGGPLVHQLPNSRWVNIGIVSWGIKCGEPGHPGIYTRVNSYLSWILANTQF